MAGLQVNPMELAFTAAMGADVPVTLTLFNPHPVERVAFKIKTTASTTYRVWPNSGALEPGETARVQVLLLGSKVDLADAARVEECCRDRFQTDVDLADLACGVLLDCFQVQFMPLAEGQAFDNSLFKMYASLVRDIKMSVCVEIVDSLDPQPAEEASPWEGMVRIALMRMMADEDREPASNAACLTKFAELLVLNGIIATEQMWGAFGLVGEMYQTPGEGQKVLSKVEQWLEHPDFLNVGDPDAASEQRSHVDGTLTPSGDSHPGTLHTPHEREEVDPPSRREGEESYPNSPMAPPSGEGSISGSERSRGGGADGPGGEPQPDGAYAFAPLSSEEPEAVAAAGAAAAEGFEDAREQLPAKPVAAESAGGFGSAQSSVSGRQEPSVSDAEDVSLADSEDQLEEVAKLAGSDPEGNSGKQPASQDSMEAEVAAARAQATGDAGQQDRAAVDAIAARAPQTRRVSAGFAAAREAALAAATVSEQQQQQTERREVTPVRVSLKERKEALASRMSRPPPDPLMEAVDDLDEAFAPDMLAEARAQMAAAGNAMAQSSVVPPTGPHMLSFSDRAAMYGAIASRSGSQAKSGSAGTGDGGRFVRQSGGNRSSSFQRLSRTDSEREHADRRSSLPGGMPAGMIRPPGTASPRDVFAQRSGTESGGFARASGAESALHVQQTAAEAAIYARRSATESATYVRQSATNSANYARQSATESATYARQSGTESTAFVRRSGTETTSYGRPSGDSGFVRYSGDGGGRRGSRRPSADVAVAGAADPAARLNGASPRNSRLRGAAPAEASPRTADPSPRQQLSLRGSSELTPRSTLNSGRSGYRSSNDYRSGPDERRSGEGASMLPLAEPQLAPAATPAAPPPPADAAPLLSGAADRQPSGGGASVAAEDELGPAVRVLLPGKQSLTRGELAAVTNGLRRGSQEVGRDLRTASTRPLSADVAPRRRSSTYTAGQVAPDGEATADTTPDGGVTPRSPSGQQQRTDAFPQTTGGAAPPPSPPPPSPAGAAGTPGPRKQKGMFKKIGAALTARAEAAARSAANQGGYYYV